MTKSTKFGKYELLERIGAGGMAEVYRARLPGAHGLDKIVAIKRILPYHSEDSAFINMFLDEAKVTLALNHPNIGTVFELNQVDDAYYIAMEFVDGPNLSTVIKHLHKAGRRMPLDLVVYIMTQVCAALFAAHTQTDSERRPMNIIHRDVSPHNVLVSHRGDVKLIDFGIAKARDRLVQTQAGTVRGKLLYMSPEHAASETLDPRSDIFSAGMMMLTLINGRHIWKGKDEVEVLVGIRRWTIPDVLELRPDIDPDVAAELQQIIARAMAFETDERYEDAEAFRIDLTQLLNTINPVFSTRDIGRFITEVAEGKTDVGEPSDVSPSAPGTNSRNAAHTTPSGPSDVVSLSTPSPAAPLAANPATSGSMPQLERESRPVRTGLREELENEVAPLETEMERPAPDIHFERTRTEIDTGSRPVAALPKPTDKRTVEADAVEAAPNYFHGEPTVARPAPATRTPSRLPRILLALVLLGGLTMLAIAIVAAVIVTATSSPQGSMELTSEPPGATIEIDGERLVGKRTPTRLDDVAPGKHVIVFSLGGATDRQLADVVAGETTTVVGRVPQMEIVDNRPTENRDTGVENEGADLAANPATDAGNDDPDAVEEPADDGATLLVFINAPRATVFLDGDKMPTRNASVKEPVEIVGLDRGKTYKLRVVKPGFEPFDKQVTVDDATVDLKVELRRSAPEENTPRGMGTLRVNSAPHWAKVYANNRVICPQTPCEKRLPAGKYRVKLTNPQVEKPLVRSVEIRPGETARLSERF